MDLVVRRQSRINPHSRQSKALERSILIMKRLCFLVFLWRTLLISWAMIALSEVWRPLKKLAWTGKMMDGRKDQIFLTINLVMIL